MFGGSHCILSICNIYLFPALVFLLLLHIEMAALRSIGTLLQSSDWTSANVEADIASRGTTESFLSASSVKGSKLFIIITRTIQAHRSRLTALQAP